MTRFTLGSCSLGTLLVARSDQGIRAILLGDDPEALARELRARAPRAEPIDRDAGLAELVAGVAGFIDAPGQGLDLPLDVRGTAFQRRVWGALRDIPAGRSATGRSEEPGARTGSTCGTA